MNGTKTKAQELLAEGWRLNYCSALYGDPNFFGFSVHHPDGADTTHQPTTPWEKKGWEPEFSEEEDLYQVLGIEDREDRATILLLLDDLSRESREG